MRVNSIEVRSALSSRLAMDDDVVKRVRHLLDFNAPAVVSVFAREDLHPTGVLSPQKGRFLFWGVTKTTVEYKRSREIMLRVDYSSPREIETALRETHHMGQAMGVEWGSLDSLDVIDAGAFSGSWSGIFQRMKRREVETEEGLEPPAATVMAKATMWATLSENDAARQALRGISSKIFEPVEVKAGEYHTEYDFGSSGGGTPELVVLRTWTGPFGGDFPLDEVLQFFKEVGKIDAKHKLSWNFDPKTREAVDRRREKTARARLSGWGAPIARLDLANRNVLLAETDDDSAEDAFSEVHRQLTMSLPQGDVKDGYRLTFQLHRTSV